MVSGASPWFTDSPRWRSSAADPAVGWENSAAGSLPSKGLGTRCRMTSGWAARAAYGGNAARAASAREHRAGVTTRPTRQTPAGSQRGPVWATRARKSEREPGTPKASGWFDNRTQTITPEQSDSPDPDSPSRGRAEMESCRSGPGRGPSEPLPELAHGRPWPGGGAAGPDEQITLRADPEGFGVAVEGLTKAQSRPPGSAPRHPARTAPAQAPGSTTRRHERGGASARLKR
jgi:hypothetical protein